MINMKVFKSIYIVLCFLAFFSCTNTEDTMRREAYDFLYEHIPGRLNVKVDSITKPYWHDSDNGANVNFSFDTPEGLKGYGNIAVVFNDAKDAIVSYSQPSIDIALNSTIKKYALRSNSIEEALGYKKRMMTVVIPEQYDESDLEAISRYLCYTRGYFSEHLNISYYLEDMSMNGPNYAFVDVRCSPYNISADVTISVITAIPQGVDLSTQAQQESDNCPFKNCKVLGTWQFVGASTLTIYVKNGSYYMATYSDGEYWPSDKLVKIDGDGYPSFRYAEDTGEYFSIHSDGLYGYSFGDLACVYNNI